MVPRPFGALGLCSYGAMGLWARYCRFPGTHLSSVN
jgi:hypothetical protein